MTNGRIDAAQVDAIISGGREEIDRLVVTGVLELQAKVTSIAQHCRYCDGTPLQTEDRRTWAMWGVLLAIARYVALPVLATIITLAITGQLGG